MSVTTSPVKEWTYDDYWALPDDSTRYEVLDGELIVMDSPTPSHQEVVRTLLVALHNFVTKWELGKVFDAPLDVVFAPKVITQPDIIFVSNERARIITDKNISGAPDLVVEVVSPSTQGRDRTRKFNLYARFGVREYWIVDRDEFTVDVFYLEEGNYREVLTTAGEARSEVLSGFVITLKDLFA